MTTIAAPRLQRDRATTRTADAEARRTLWVAAAATLLVLAVFSAVVTTVGDSLRSLHGDVSSQTWTLSGMSLGLAAALLTVGALRGRLRAPPRAGRLDRAARAHERARRRRPEHGRPHWRPDPAGGSGRGRPGGIARSDRARLPHRSSAHVRRQRVGLLGRGRHRDRPARRRRDRGMARLAQQLLARGRRGGRPGRGGRRDRGVAGLDQAPARSLGRSRPRPRDGGPDRRADRRPPELVGLGTIIPLAAGVVLLGAFVAIEFRKREPILEIERFKNPLFLASLSGALFTGLAVIGLMSFTPLLLQLGLGVSVIGSAGVLAAWSTTSMAVALATRRLLGRRSAARRSSSASRFPPSECSRSRASAAGHLGRDCFPAS